MSSLSILRRVHVIGLLGSALLISGLFLPWITTNFSEPSLLSVTQLFWLQVMSQVQVTFRGFDWPSVVMSIGWYFFTLLPILMGILVSLAGLFDKGKRVFFVLYLVFVIIGLLAFLLISYVDYCIFYCGVTGLWALKGTRILGPGFWLILSGYLVSLGVSIAQNRLFKPRAT